MKTKLIFTLALLCVFTGNAQWGLLNSPSNYEAAMAVVNTDTIVTVTGERIYSTDNGGQTWTFYQTPYQGSWLYDVHFPTDQVGYACGGTAFGMYRNIIVKTSDGGQTWSEVTVNEYPGYVFTDIYFIDENVGFVTGSAAGLLKTTDGGLSFSPISFSEYHLVYDIVFSTDNIGFLSAMKPYDPDGDGLHHDAIYRILKTTDQGESWAINFVVDTVYDASTIDKTKQINRIQFLDANTGFVVGNAGLFMKTTDAGATWDVTTIPPYTNLSAVYFTSPTTGYINNAGGIYKTTNGGTTWTVQNIFPLDIIHEIRFANDTIGYALGEDGIYKTINGGGTGLGVEKVKLKNKLIVYPNPAKENLYLKTAAQLSIEKIKLFDMRGKTVREYPSNARQLEVNNLAPGNYFLKFSTKQGVITKKVMVK